MILEVTAEGKEAPIGQEEFDPSLLTIFHRFPLYLSRCVSGNPSDNSEVFGLE